MMPLVDPRVPWLAERARRDPDAEAVVAAGARLSFAELARRSARIAAALAHRGIRRGDRVACRLEPSLGMVELFHGIAWLGATAVLVNPRLTTAEQAPLLERAAPALEIDAEALAELARTAPATVPEAASPRAGELAVILFTSGTTVTPKGVMIGADALFASAVASRERLGIAAADRWLGTLPLHHVGGLSILVRSVLDGVPVELHPRFDAEAAVRAIRAGVSLVSLVATTLGRLLDVDQEPFPSTLRAVLLGGGPIPPGLVERALARGVPVFSTYGLTEAASQVATATPELARRKPGSVGRPLRGMEIRLAEMDAEGRGEILVRGPALMQGYWRDPAATARALRDGWLTTGDIGRLDHDGDLWIEDRRSDLVVTGGENVSPAEVEAVLLDHPGICEAGVYGEPDPLWGQRVVAAVVQRGEPTITLEEVRRHCAAKLARFKLPRALRVLDALPRTASGKLQRHRLRDGAESAGPASTSR